MSILTVTSTNPDFSHIIAKNPATIANAKKPFERELRKGKVYGWFPKADNSQFRLMFIDAVAENSFGERDEFEYLDLSRYSNAYLPIMMINTALNSASSQVHDHDTPNFETEVEFTIKCPNRILRRFEGMQGVNLSYAVVADDHFKVTVKDFGVMKALNAAIVVSLIAALADEDTYIPLPQEGIAKYLKVLDRVDAPYYMRHLFVSRAITNRALFTKLNDNIQCDTISFKFGNTQIQRFDAIKEALVSKGKTHGNSLVDIGCGEMFHSMRLASEYESVIGYDADENIFAKNSSFILKKKLENVVCIQQNIDAVWVIENADLLAGNDVLLSEVIEHNDKEFSQTLISALLQTEANRILITVPNKDFNKYYALADDEFRHPDHKWEPTPTELGELISKSLPENFLDDWILSVTDIGDMVTEDEVSHSVSIMVVFSRRNKV